MRKVKLAETDQEIDERFAVMAQLRPHLVREKFVQRVRRQQEQGFRLAFVEDSGAVVAVAGFRLMEMLSGGRTLYVDDLITDEARRSRGHGKELLRWLQRYAREAGCETFSLDSGTHRQEAHAFYFREGMRVTGFHFATKMAERVGQ